MANFWDISEAVLLENSSIKKSWAPIQFLKNPGRHLDRFTGKLIQSSIGEFWGVTETVLLENSSIRKYLVKNNILKILGRHILLENSSRQFFKSFFNFFNLFKPRQKKPLFLEEKQVNDETKNGKGN